MGCTKSKPRDESNGFIVIEDIPIHNSTPSKETSILSSPAVEGEFKEAVTQEEQQTSQQTAIGVKKKLKQKKMERNITTNMCRACYYHLKDLRRIRKFLSVETAALLANSMISSRLDYCNSLLYGNLDSDQIDTLREAFGMFDKDGNGAISKDELMCVMTNLGLKPTEQEVKDIINEFDIDKSEHIEFDEFCHFMERQMNETQNYQQEDASNELLCAFKAFDKDGSGTISKSELRTVMTNLGEELTDDELREMIAEADKDGDGEINYYEFTQMMLSKA